MITERPIRQRDFRDRTINWDPGGEGQQTQKSLWDCKEKSRERQWTPAVGDVCRPRNTIYQQRPNGPRSQNGSKNGPKIRRALPNHGFFVTSNLQDTARERKEGAVHNVNTSEQLQHADTTVAKQHWSPTDSPKILQVSSQDTSRSFQATRKRRESAEGISRSIAKTHRLG